MKRETRCRIFCGLVRGLCGLGIVGAVSAIGRVELGEIGMLHGAVQLGVSFGAAAVGGMFAVEINRRGYKARKGFAVISDCQARFRRCRAAGGNKAKAFSGNPNRKGGGTVA